MSNNTRNSDLNMQNTPSDTQTRGQTVGVSNDLRQEIQKVVQEKGREAAYSRWPEQRDLIDTMGNSR